MARNILSDSHDGFPRYYLMTSSERKLKSPGFPRPDVGLALSTDPRLEMDMASNSNNHVDDSGKATDTASLPIREETRTSERGEVITTVPPQAPAAAPSNSLSDTEEAQPQAHKRNRARRRASKAKSTVPLTLEEMFGIQSETWTRFHTITNTGYLDNVEIYDCRNFFCHVL